MARRSDALPGDSLEEFARCALSGGGRGCGLGQLGQSAAAYGSSFQRPCFPSGPAADGALGTQARPPPAGSCDYGYGGGGYGVGPSCHGAGSRSASRPQSSDSRPPSSGSLGVPPSPEPPLYGLAQPQFQGSAPTAGGDGYPSLSAGRSGGCTIGGGGCGGSFGGGGCEGGGGGGCKGSGLNGGGLAGSTPAAGPCRGVSVSGSGVHASGGCSGCSCATPDATTCSEPPPGEGVLVSLPRGIRLQLDLLSTWGDPFYVGLAGLEAFDEAGERVPLGAGRVWAEPSDLNVLPEFAGLPAHRRDPRVVSNLVDECFSTCDDRHLWLSPFTRGVRNTVGVDMTKPIRLSALRVWNYNKSRIHSFRGARHIEIRLDGVLVFRGEINKAPGNSQEAFACAETILFSLDEAALHRIEQSDAQRHGAAPPAGIAVPGSPGGRPLTPGDTAGVPACGGGDTGGGGVDLRPRCVPSAVTSASSRPVTSAGGREAWGAIPAGGGFTPTLPPIKQDYEVRLHPKGRVLTIVCESTWGDVNYLGLNGVEVLTPDGSRLNLAHATATADPIGVCALPGMATDARRVEQLLLGGESQWGWLAPFTPGTSCWVEIRLPEAVALGAVRLFNYAKTPSRGVREFQLLLDGAIIFGGVLRAAPLGNAGAVSGERPDFVQTVLFTSNQELIDSERHHVYTKEDLEDELQVFDNGLLANQRIPRDSSGRQQRPTTSCIRS